MLECDRYWLITWTTYGTWLPGDRRGFVSNVTSPSTAQHPRNNIPGTPIDNDIPELLGAAQSRLKSSPVRLNPAQAGALAIQFRETAQHRSWMLFAAAIMANHCHLVVGVPGDPDPARLLSDFKSYGSRALNGNWARPDSGTWWTESGSKRKLPDEEAVLSAVQYVIHQQHPLVIWTTEIPELDLPDRSQSQ